MSSSTNIDNCSHFDETKNADLSTTVEPIQKNAYQECSPEAYLETLDSVVACSRLLNTQSLLDQKQIDHVSQLLYRAKTLFVDNAVSLILQSLKDVHRDKALPSFWKQVCSQHECNLWLRLFDIILFCWSKDIILDKEKSSTSISQNNTRKCGNFVEHQVFQYQSEIRRLRSVYYLPFEENDLEQKLEESSRKMSVATEKVKQLLRPVHIVLLTNLKKPVKELKPVLQIVNAMLEILELATAIASNAELSWLDTKSSLEKLSIIHLDKFTNLHHTKLNFRTVNKLRNVYLQNSAFNETAIRNLESNLKTNELKSLTEVAVQLLHWMTALENYDRICERSFTFNGQFHK